MEYLVRVGETSNLECLVRTLAEQVPEYEEKFMTIAEQLEVRGREKGLKQGRQKGEELGRQEAQLAIAKKMLAAGLDSTLISETTDLSEVELAKLISTRTEWRNECHFAIFTPQISYGVTGIFFVNYINTTGGTLTVHCSNMSFSFDHTNLQ